MNSIFFFMANKIYIPIGYKIVNKNCVINLNNTKI